MKSLREFCTFFALQCLVYGIVTWNYRAIAQARYIHIGLSDLIFAAINFGLIKRVSEAKSRAAWAGYTLGGACGSLLSAWVSRMVFGQ